MSKLSENLADIEARIVAACVRGGRDRSEVRLLAVTKTQPPAVVRKAAACGLRLFGENRVQEAAAKIPECPGNLEWHLIGHLQSNKAALAARLFDWIHSVDSLDLLEALDRHAGEAGRRLKILLQVNVSGERSKSGMAPEDAPEVLAVAAGLANVEVCGLMTIPPALEDLEKVRPYFRQLRQCRDEWSTSMDIPLPELSMGMTYDMGTAIEEGATMIRVGTGLFGARPKTTDKPDV